MRISDHSALCLLLSAMSVLGLCGYAQAAPKEHSLWDLSYRSEYAFTQNPDDIAGHLGLQGPRAAEMRGLLERQTQGPRQTAFSRLSHSDTFAFLTHRDESPKAPSAEETCKLLPATQAAARKGKLRVLNVKPAKLGDLATARASWEAEMSDGIWSGETLCLRQGPRNWQMDFQIRHIKDKKANRARILAAREEAAAVFNSIHLLEPERAVWNIGYRGPYPFTDNIGELAAMGLALDTAARERVAADIEHAKQPRNRMRVAFTRLKYPDSMGGVTRYEGDLRPETMEKLCRESAETRAKPNGALVFYKTEAAVVSGMAAVRASWRVRTDIGMLNGETLCGRDTGMQTLWAMEFLLFAPPEGRDVDSWRAEAMAVLDSVRLLPSTGNLKQYEQKRW